MKIRLVVIALLMLFMNISQAEATQLPKEVKAFLTSQKKVPTIRHDGVVVYNNEATYIPILPAYPENVEKLSIVQTYPENQTMDKLPDMVVFNNNLSLLKLIKTGSDSYSVRNLKEWPVVLKTGAIPQDLVVPRGLVMPDSLAGILGDVKIPLIGSAKTTTFISGRRTAPLPTGKRIEDTKPHNVPAELKNKLFFVNNFQTEYLQIFSSSVSEPLYSLKTSGVMKDIKPILNGKFILAATADKKNVDVIDVKNEFIAKNIVLTAIPSEIAVDETNKKAYVASIKDESLSIIDLNEFTVKEKIQLVGSPQKLSISEDGTKIAYIDMKTSNIYLLDLLNNYENKLISNYPNATKLILKKNEIYIISRTQPKLRVINFDILQDNKITKSKKEKRREESIKEEEKRSSEEITDSLIYDSDDSELLGNKNEDKIKTYATSIKDYEIGIKPVDMNMQGNKLFILCAGDNSVYKYDKTTKEITSTKLPVDGFSKSFTPVPNSNLAVITNMSDLKYVVYDTNKEQAIQTYPISEYVNMITILER